MLRNLLLLSLLTLSSCGSNPQDLQTLRLNIVHDPISLDPRVVRLVKDLTVVRQLFDGLYRLDQEGVPQPALAKSCEISPDRLTYTFELKEAAWTDGEPVTAHDFVFAWRQVLDPNFVTDYAYMLYPIKNARACRMKKCRLDEVGIRVINALEFEVTLEQPTPYFLELTAFPTFFPVPEKTVRQHPNWVDAPAKHCVSNGPFKLKQWIPGTELLLEKNPTYWDRAAVHLDKISFALIEDNNTESLLFETGELDWLGQPFSQNISPELFGKLKQEGMLDSYSVAGTLWLQVNVKQEPFTSPEMRACFAMAINREALIEHVLQGNQQVALNPLPPSIALQKNAPFSDNNIEMAKKIFDHECRKRGWNQRNFPVITFKYAMSERNNKLAQAIQQQWQETFGIPIKLEHLEHQYYLNEIKQGRYQVGVGDWIADYHDPMAFLEIFHNTDNGINNTQWNHSQYAHLIERAVVESDLEKRNTLMQKAENLLLQEMPVIPIYYYSFDYLKKGYVKNVVLSPLGSSDFKHVELIR